MKQIDRALPAAHDTAMLMIPLLPSARLARARRMGLLVPLLLSVLTAGHGADPTGRTGIVRVHIVGASGEKLPARAWVDDAAGNRLFTPGQPATCTPYPRDRSFSCDGWFELTAPAGRVVVHVEKGKEFLPVDQPVELRAGETTEATITLHRWVNMPERGYYSADLHVHFGRDNPVVLRQLSLADDVHVVPVFTYWLVGRESAWNREWPAWAAGGTERVDAFHFVTRANLEIERISSRAFPAGTVGASFIFNLDRPVSADRFDERYPTDTTLCLWAKATSPECVIDTDKPSWAETPVGAALGVYDVAQICHNHYHRAGTQAGGWGMIGPLTPEEKDLSERDELFRRTNTQYYHWLNCGIRMGVSGGSAMGVKPAPIGFSRTYAKVDGPLTPAGFWRAVKAGRTFATSGPMLTMTVGRQEMGATIRRTTAENTPLRIEVQLQSIDAIQHLELVSNGEIVRQEQVPLAKSGAGLDYAVSWEVLPRRSGWYASRALYVSPDGGLRQAHTSPVYVIFDDKPIAFRQSAEYMMRWIDRLIEVAEMPGRYQQEPDKAEVLDQYRQAWRFYQDVARTAGAVWGD